MMYKAKNKKIKNTKDKEKNIKFVGAKAKASDENHKIYLFK